MTTDHATAAPRPDRRAEAKARTRRAIVDAAAALMGETRSTAFSVDELAERAGVSRRTVFNHFASLDDVVAAVGADAFSTILDALVAADPPRTGSPRADARADLAGALRASELVGPMAALARGLGLGSDCILPDGAVGHVADSQAVLLLRALHDLGSRLVRVLSDRHPDLDRLDRELDVAAFISGLVVLFGHWCEHAPPVDDAASRAVWSEVVDRFVRSFSHIPRTTTPTPTEGHHG